MAGPWLYPISMSAQHSFTLEESRQSIPVTDNSYRALVEDGRIVEDQHWYISQHWDNVEVGDELFIYTGDRNLGIIGYAGWPRLPLWATWGPLAQEVHGEAVLDGVPLPPAPPRSKNS